MEALPVMERALDIREMHLPPNDREIEEVMLKLTDIYYKIGKQTPPHWPS